jgi:hypothetical protein
MRYARDPLSVFITRDCVKLAALHLALFFIEKRGDHIDTGWISHQNDSISQLLWFQMQMENRAIRIDDKF